MFEIPDFALIWPIFIFPLVLKNIKSWGCHGQRYRSFTKYAIWPKSTLLVKIFDLDPEKKILLYIRKGLI